jgi:hypothetical protein
MKVLRSDLHLDRHPEDLVELVGVVRELVLEGRSQVTFSGGTPCRPDTWPRPLVFCLRWS